MLYLRGRRLPARPAAPLRRVVLDQHAGGACPRCHGLGRVYDATERVDGADDTLTIRERAIAAWPPAWHGQNLRDIVTTLGYDVRRALGRPAEEGPGLAAVHRRAAERARLPGRSRDEVKDGHQRK
jgi:excinuclease UvrABC ATPase subunit